MIAQSPLSKVRAQVRLLPVHKLVPSPDNRRRPITQRSIESLAKSVLKDGIIQPIVVREHPQKDGFYEIRAGERRWHAAKLAGLKEIPALVRKLDDQSALSVTIAENMQRENLHPLEEAETVQLAFDRGYDLKQVAARLGKSVKVIARRASLTRLSKVWQDEILKPNSQASRLTVGHLEVIARLPEETQDHLAEGHFHQVFGRGFPTVEELTRLVDGGLRTLHAMPWKADDETLEPEAGSCVNCPKRSSKHPLLFDGAEPAENGRVPKGDRCLDPACYIRKEVAHVKRCETDAKAKHPNLRLVQIGYSGLNRGMQEAFGDRVVRLYNPKVVTAGAKNAVPVMQVDGPKAGSVVYVAPDTSAMESNGHAKKLRPKDAAGNPVPIPLSERKERLKKRREAHLVEKVAQTLKGLTPESLARIVGEMAKRTDGEAKKFDALPLVLAFGTSQRADREDGNAAWKRYDSLLTHKAESPVLAALHDVIKVWVHRLANPMSHTVLDQGQDARRMCEVLDIKYGVFESEAIMAIPTPKSWAEEQSRGGSDREEPPFDPKSSPDKAGPKSDTRDSSQDDKKHSRK